MQTDTRLMKRVKKHRNDTGSPEVQIAILTESIEEVAAHLKKHRADHSSRRGLLRMVQKRRHLLEYLKRTNQIRYLLMLEVTGLDR